MRVMDPKRREISLIVVVTLLTILSIALAITLILQVLVTPTKKSSRQCTTKDCIRAASSYLDSLDFDINPCEDFYSFVCNGYSRSTSPLADHFQHSKNILLLQVKALMESPNKPTDPSAVKKLRFAYQVCLNTTRIKQDGIKHLRLFVNEFLNGWPIAIGLSWQANNKNLLEQLLVKLARSGFMMSLFSFSLTVDAQNPVRYRIKLDQPDENEDLYESSKQKQRRTTTRYDKRKKRDLVDQDKEVSLSTVVNVAKLLGNNNTFQVKTDAQEMFRLESNLKDISSSTENRSNLSSIYNKMTIKKLSEITDNVFDWLEFFKMTFAGYTNIDENEEIIVAEVDYFRKLPQILRKFRTKDHLNLAIWNAINDLLEYAVVIDEKGSRWKSCVDDASKIFPFAAWRIYADKFVSVETMKSLQEFVDNLNKAYSDIIQDVKWLTPSTKSTALKKLKNLAWVIGYPLWIQDDKLLDNYYSNYMVTQDHFVNIIKAYHDKTDRDFKSFRLRVDKTEWPEDLGVLNANAFNLISANQIIIPGSLLQPPFYAANQLHAINYGCIGTIIGHEIGHAFDDEGSQLDENVVLRDWWNQSDYKEYLKRSRCFKDQYDEYCFDEVEDRDIKKDTCLNGQQTLGENVPDNTGLHCAHTAYKKWVKTHGEEDPLPGLTKFTNEQLFFISYAYQWCENIDSKLWFEYFETEAHSPGRYRVIGSLSNSVAFRNAFNCPVGLMNRGNQTCILW